MFIGALFRLLLWLLRWGPNAVARSLGGGVVLGLFWQQVAFVGHDIGHNAFTHSRAVDAALGLLVGNAITGAPRPPTARRAPYSRSTKRRRVG